MFSLTAFFWLMVTKIDPLKFSRPELSIGLQREEFWSGKISILRSKFSALSQKREETLEAGCQ